MTKRAPSIAPQRRTVLVTGANRGIGLAATRLLARQGLRVVLTARRMEDAVEAARAFGAERLDVRAEEIDLASEASIQACAARLARAGIEVDALVNNGAVLFQGDVLTTSSDDFRRAVDVNLLGAVWCCRAFVPGMVARNHGRVVNVSSGWGAFSEGLDGPASYSITKAALNALTVSLARSTSGDVKVNACSPGWVRTRMGGAGADRSPEEGAEVVAWLATLPKDGPDGGFFRDRTPIAW
ncbi:MAG: SDR family NAD(P)-dependent oxidoreductase [Planctomycetes bacterium]|nr:SDR family NAD(P)-dependent oxidoreductase [Planctomycetota bacterium]